MSLKRLAVISAVGSHNSFNNQTISYVSSYSGAGGSGSSVEQGTSGSGGSNLRTGGHHHQGLQTMRPGANLHGNVNIMLGGAMLSVVVTVVCFVCYCCHRNIKKRSNSIYRQQWLDTEANMEIYSVEQCYDPPASSGGTSGFFMDSGNSGLGDYQSLPVMTSAINHNAQLQFPYHQHQHYHHLHQQHHCAPYPNGPPPSYDAVVAQDELLLANVASRRKRSGPEASEPPADESPGSSCSVDPEQEDCKRSCTGALLQKSRNTGGRLRRTLTRADDDGSDSAGEPFWRSVELEEAERQEEQRNAAGNRGGVTGGTHCNCTTMTNDRPSTNGEQVPAIYCRNCGYYVEDGGNGQDVPAETRSLWLDALNNEALLVDYATTVPSDLSQVQRETETVRNETSVNRNIVIDDSSNAAIIATTTTNVAIGRLPVQMMSSSPGTPGRLDTMNNNNGSDETDGRATEPTSFGQIRHPFLSPSDHHDGSQVTNEAVLFGVRNENNNVNIGSSPRTTSPPDREDANLIEILDNCLPVEDGFPRRTRANQGASGNQATSEEAAAMLEDQTNGNSSTRGSERDLPESSSTQPPGIRRLLDENGLVRVDMSQIIDNTGLPTYEAALKLESSGYV